MESRILKSQLFISFLFFSFGISAQSLKPISIIEYHIDDLGEFRAISKVDYQYDDDLRIKEESRYENLGLNDQLKWRLSQKMNQNFNKNQLRTLSIDERYYYQNESTSEINETYITETITSYSDDADLLSNSIISSSFDKYGNFQSYNAFRTDRRYDGNGCLAELSESWSNDPNTRPQDYNQSGYTEYITDPLCRNSLINQYIGGRLVYSVAIEYDQAGDVIFQEETRIRPNGDPLERFRYITEKDKFERVTISRFEVEIVATGEVGYNETRYAYSNRARPDTIFYTNKFVGYNNRSFNTFEYDDQDQIILSRSYSFLDSLSDEAILTSESTTEYDSQNRIIRSTYERYSEMGILVSNGESTTEYHKGDLRLKTVNINNDYHNGTISSTTEIIQKNVYDCDDLLQESTIARDGTLTSRTEYIYPIASACEASKEPITFTHMYDGSRLTIWSHFLSGQDVLIQLISTDGRIIQSQRVNSTLQASLAVSNLSSGIYFLSMSTESSRVSKSLFWGE